MSRSRASAIFAALVAMMAMVAGTVAFTSAAASASPNLHPHPPYPPPPPALVVNHGWVKQNSTVRATGRKYGNRERVYVTITYRGTHHGRPVVQRTVAYADRSGRFSLRLRLTRVGRVVIRATGSRSGKSASAVVIVRRKHGHGPHFETAAFGTALDAAGSSGLTTASATPPADDRGLAIAGIGALALLSGAAITSQVTRRRRRVQAG